MGDVIFLALAPWWLRDGHSIRAALNNVGDGVAEPVANVGNAAVSTGVFAGVVQQGGDGFTLVRAIFEGDAGHAQQVGDIRSARTFANLVGMHEDGVVQGVFKFG